MIQPSAQPHDNASIHSVLLENVFIDREHYQRTPIAKHIATIVETFDPKRAMLLTVNLRPNNTIALIDGQHRLLAMRKMGLRSWDAVCWQGLTIQQEAALFLMLQTGTRVVTAMDRWKAELVAGNVLVTAVDQVVRDCGFSIRQVAKSEDPCAISCPDALLRIAHPGRAATGDAERVRAVLDFVSRCWPRDEFSTQKLVLAGVDHFLRNYGPKLDMPSAYHRFRQTPLPGLVRMAVSIRDGERTAPTAAMSRALQRTYDLRRTSGRLVKLEVAQES